MKMDLLRERKVTSYVGHVRSKSQDVVRMCVCAKKWVLRLENSRKPLDYVTQGGDMINLGFYKGDHGCREKKFEVV